VSLYGLFFSVRLPTLLAECLAAVINVQAVFTRLHGSVRVL